jgi:hypothetical protein
MFKLVKIGSVKGNSRNPRFIRDEKFKKLVASLVEFPEMATLRPLVVDENMTVLGGNMRLKAMQELKWKEVPIVVAEGLTDAQKDEFVIKDNVGFGDWNWEQLANEWDAEELTRWGLDIPNYSFGHDANDMDESELDLDEEFDPIGKASGLWNVVFIFDSQEDAEKYLKEKNIEFVKFAPAWKVNMSSRFTLSAKGGLQPL